MIVFISPLEKRTEYVQYAKYTPRGRIRIRS